MFIVNLVNISLNRIKVCQWKSRVMFTNFSKLLAEEDEHKLKQRFQTMCSLIIRIFYLNMYMYMYILELHLTGTVQCMRMFNLH